jgi:uncharacterized protein YbjT (DUF2867 family)
VTILAIDNQNVNGSNIHMGQTAILIGATGLVGSEILNYALNDARFSKIKVFVRRSTGISDPKLEEFIIDFEKLGEWRHEIKGDVLFSALGTTLKQVGTREAQRIVDYDYQLRVAQAAKLNGVINYVLVSAPNADPKSNLAYTKMKGDLERDVMKLSFPKITIIRPGILKGPRAHKRLVEYNLGVVLSIFPTIPGLESIKPVSGKLVAHACIETAFDAVQGQRILNPKDVLQFLK